MPESPPSPAVAASLAGLDYPISRPEEFLEVLGTEPEGDFNDLAELAASLCSTPMALVSFLGADQQFHKGAVGFWTSSLPLGDAFYDYTVRGDGLLLVEDAKADKRFTASRMVAQEPWIRFYAGLPLYAPSGDKVGTLCVADSVRRGLQRWQSRSLTLLGRQANARLELRLRRRAAELALEQAAHNDLLFTTFANSLPFPCYIKDREHRVLFYNSAAAERFGIDEKQWLGRTSFDLWPLPVAERIYKAEEHVFATGERSDLELTLPSLHGLPPASFVLHQRLCRAPAGAPVLCVLALEAAR